MTDKRHIYRTASMISEDINEYDGLEDNDEFNVTATRGYGNGYGVWQYEEFPFMVHDQLLLGAAVVDYDPYMVHNNMSVDDIYSVIDFEIYSGPELTYQWDIDRGLTHGQLSENELKDVLEQIRRQFENDEDRVIEYVTETHQDFDDGRY